MISETIMQLFDQYGYLFFFLAFCLGPFGIPVPNEITIITGGTLSSNGNLNPWIVYILILAGLLSAITVAYITGRFFGERFQNKLQLNRHFNKAGSLLTQYGDIAMCMGVFIPIIRYVLPVVVGLSGVSYKKFALFSYSTAFIWTAVFFILGKLFGNHLMNF